MIKELIERMFYRNFVPNKNGCGRAFTDDDCEDGYQFWFCGKIDEDDGRKHYCKRCYKKQTQNEELKSK